MYKHLSLCLTQPSFFSSSPLMSLQSLNKFSAIFFIPDII